VNISFGSSGFKPERFSFNTEPPDVPELRDDIDCIPIMKFFYQRDNNSILTSDGPTHFTSPLTTKP
jgi:hypothetical protein